MAAGPQYGWIGYPSSNRYCGYHNSDGRQCRPFTTVGFTGPEYPRRFGVQYVTAVGGTDLQMQWTLPPGWQYEDGNDSTLYKYFSPNNENVADSLQFINEFTVTYNASGSSAYSFPEFLSYVWGESVDNMNDGFVNQTVAVSGAAVEIADLTFVPDGTTNPRGIMLVRVTTAGAQPAYLFTRQPTPSAEFVQGLEITQEYMNTASGIDSVRSPYGITAMPSGAVFLTFVNGDGHQELWYMTNVDDLTTLSYVDVFQDGAFTISHMSAVRDDTMLLSLSKNTTERTTGFGLLYRATVSADGLQVTGGFLEYDANNEYLNAGTGVYVMGRPFVKEDGSIYVSAGNALFLVDLEPASGNPRWVMQSDSSTAAVGYNLVSSMTSYDMYLGIGGCNGTSLGFAVQPINNTLTYPSKFVNTLFGQNATEYYSGSTLYANHAAKGVTEALGYVNRNAAGTFALYSPVIVNGSSPGENGLVMYRMPPFNGVAPSANYRAAQFNLRGQAVFVDGATLSIGLGFYPGAKGPSRWQYASSMASTTSYLVDNGVAVPGSQGTSNSLTAPAITLDVALEGVVEARDNTIIPFAGATVTNDASSVTITLVGAAAGATLTVDDTVTEWTAAAPVTDSDTGDVSYTFVSDSESTGSTVTQLVTGVSVSAATSTDLPSVVRLRAGYEEPVGQTVTLQPTETITAMSNAYNSGTTRIYATFDSANNQGAIYQVEEDGTVNLCESGIVGTVYSLCAIQTNVYAYVYRNENGDSSEQRVIWMQFGYTDGRVYGDGPENIGVFGFSTINLLDPQKFRVFSVQPNTVTVTFNEFETDSTALIFAGYYFDHSNTAKLFEQGSFFSGYNMGAPCINGLGMVASQRSTDGVAILPRGLVGGSCSGGSNNNEPYNVSYSYNDSTNGRNMAAWGELKANSIVWGTGATVQMLYAVSANGLSILEYDVSRGTMPPSNFSEQSGSTSHRRTQVNDEYRMKPVGVLAGGGTTTLERLITTTEDGNAFFAFVFDSATSERTVKTVVADRATGTLTLRDVGTLASNVVQGVHSYSVDPNTASVVLYDTASYAFKGGSTEVSVQVARIENRLAVAVIEVGGAEDPLPPQASTDDVAADAPGNWRTAGIATAATAGVLALVAIILGVLVSRKLASKTKT